jgi:hypothetical protein
LPERQADLAKIGDCFLIFPQTRFVPQLQKGTLKKVDENCGCTTFEVVIIICRTSVQFYSETPASSILIWNPRFLEALLVPEQVPRGTEVLPRADFLQSL